MTSKNKPVDESSVATLPAPEAHKSYRHRTIGDHPLHPETQMMGYGYDPALSEGSVKCPIFQTSTFAFKTAEDGKAFFEQAHGVRASGPDGETGLIYSRINNPDIEVLENRLTLWDRAEAGAVFSSGMGAIASMLLTFLRPGDVVVHSQPMYGGTETLLEKFLPQFGIQRVGFIAGAGHLTLDEAVAEAKKKGRVGMIFIETPANPTNGLVDIRACADAAKAIDGGERGRPVVAVDNTFLGPLWQRPLEHGADLVVYSLTKYVGGHSDLVAGGCLGSTALISRMRPIRSTFGSNLDPHTCWLLMRSLETLQLRMTRATENARAVAEYLAGHPKVEKVEYLGFLREDDPQYGIYRRQCDAPGSTFAFLVRGGEHEAFRVLNALQHIKLAVSLGGTESLMQHPAAMTHSDMSPEKLNALGVTPNLLRLSVGIEHPDDLIADLEQALKAI
jgi:methionine-gamma-lyase